MTESDWTTSFFDSGFEETFRRLGKYDTTDQDITHLLDLVAIPPGGRILDVPCGWGRHAGRLNNLGFHVVGIDSSPHQIQRARDLWPDVTFYQHDMRQIPETDFDTVLNLWTSFGSLPEPTDDIAALRSWFTATVPGGSLVMELTTREYAEAANRKDSEPVGVKSVTINDVREDARFDWKQGTSHNTYTHGQWQRTCTTRLYTRPQLRNMLDIAGYTTITMYGGFTGEPTRDDRRTVIVAHRNTND